MRFLVSPDHNSMHHSLHTIVQKIRSCLYTDQGLWFLIGLFIGMVIMTAVTDRISSNRSANEAVIVSVASTDTVLAFASSSPTTLRIPKINLKTNFSESLGLTADSELEVPDSYTSVGWYRFGPTPGAVGPAVVVGHVDSYEGPAVFFSLGKLEPGDEIFVDRADGTTARFVVTALERPAQSAFPTQSVYGDIDHAGLRLITCTGTYVRGVNRYTHNLIVYARLVT